jgi:hypothetical protein
VTLEEQRLVAELQDAGLNVDSIWDLVNSNQQFPEVLPILVNWLSRLEPNSPERATRSFAEAVVRSLSVPKAPKGTAAKMIKLLTECDMTLPSGLPWAIGNALSIVAEDSNFDRLAEIVRDTYFGIARQGVVLALGKSRRPEAVDVLLGVLDDDDVTGHVLISLRKIRAVGTEKRIEPYLTSPRAWIRKEAAKTLKALAPADE